MSEAQKTESLRMAMYELVKKSGINCKISVKTNGGNFSIQSTKIQ